MRLHIQTPTHKKYRWTHWLWLCFVWPGTSQFAYATQNSDTCQRLTRQHQYDKAAQCFRGLAHKEAVEHCMEGIVNRKLADQLTNTTQKQRYYTHSLQSFERCSQGGSSWKEAAERHTIEIKKMLGQLRQKSATQQTTSRPKPTERRPRHRYIEPTPRPKVPNSPPGLLHRRTQPQTKQALTPPTPPPLTAKRSTRRPVWPWIVGVGLVLGVGTAIGVTIYFVNQPASVIEFRVPVGS